MNRICSFARYTCLFLVSFGISAQTPQVKQELVGEVLPDKKTELVSVLTELKAVLEQKMESMMRAYRPDAHQYGQVPGAPVPPPDLSGSTADVEKVRALVCLIEKCLGCPIDHEDSWTSLIDAIECTKVENPELPENFTTAASIIADALTQTLIRIGCIEPCETLFEFPDDVIGRLCFIKGQIEIVDSKLDIIDDKIETIDSKVDVVTDIVLTIESKVFAQNEEIRTLDSKIDVIDEEIDTIDSKVDIINDIVLTIESKVFAQNEEIRTLDSKLDVIDEEIDTLDSKVDVINDIVLTIESKVFDQNEEIFTLDSKIDVIDQEVDTLDSKIDVINDIVLTVESKLFDQNEELRTLDSKLDVIDQEIETLDSKVDVITDILLTVESKVFDQNEEIRTFDSKVDVVDEEIDTLDSKVDVVNELILTIESKVFDQNEEIRTFDSKVDVVDEEIDTLDSKVDVITDIALTIESKVFMQNDELRTLDSKLDVIDQEISLIDGKIDNAIEIAETIESKVFIQNDELLTIDSKIDELLLTQCPCINTTYLCQEDFNAPPFDITQPGLYVLCENVKFSGGAVFDITSSDVIIDLNGKVIDVNGNSNLFNVSTRNITIKNGEMRNFGSGGLAILSEASDIRIESVDFIPKSTGAKILSITASVDNPIQNVVISDCFFTGTTSNITNDVLLSFTACKDVIIKDCRFNQVNSKKIIEVSNSQKIDIINSTFNDNDFKNFDDSSALNLLDSDSCSVLGCEFKNNFFNGDGSCVLIENGFDCIIKDCTLVNNTAGSDKVYTIYLKGDSSLHTYGRHYVGNCIIDGIVSNEISIGVFSSDEKENIIENCVISNIISGESGSDASWGIRFRNNDRGLIQNCTISHIDPDDLEDGYGIALEGFVASENKDNYVIGCKVFDRKLCDF